MDYGPALPPRLVLDQHDTLDQYVAPSELPPKKVSDSHKKLVVGRKSIPGLPRINLMKNPMNLGSLLPKLKSTLIRVNTNQGPDVSSSSGEDQSPVARHRSSKPSRAQPSGAVSDQDLPQHDRDPPYYREVALSDIPSQYAEEVDTLRRIFSLPDPRESMPRSSTSVMGLDDEKAIKSSDVEVLPLFCPSAQLSRTPLINFNMTLRLLIYPRVNTSSRLLPPLSGTGWDSPVIRTNFRS